MGSQLQAASIGAAHAAAVASEFQAPSLLKRALACPAKLLWGMIFCQSLTGSIFVVGWTYRLAQRSALKFWFSLSSYSKDRSGFARFAAAHESLRGQVHWPNWFAQQNFRQAARPAIAPGSIRYGVNAVRALAHSLWLNLWVGLAAIANTWALTLPAGVLWWFGWYDGWNNSFNKGYEQAAVGPLISVLGIAWFIAAMFYVPLAQARQAVTGQWRSFFEFRLIWRLARHQWAYCIMLAGLYSLLSIPLAILKTSPMFWLHNSPTLATLTSLQVLAALKSYFFWCALIVLPAFVIVHLAAARIYASGILSLVQSGKVAHSELAANERAILDQLGLLVVQADPQRHVLVRVVTWMGARIGRVGGAWLLAAIWFSFVAQIYITEFLNHHSGLVWLNQPLVQLPWFRYLPSAVRNPVGEVVSALLVVLLGLLLLSIVRTWQRLKPPLIEAAPTRGSGTMT